MMEHFCTSLRTVLWIGLIVRLKGIDGTDPGEGEEKQTNTVSCVF